MTQTYTKPAIEATFKSSRNAVTQPTTELFREPAFHIATKSTAAAAIKTKEEATFSKLSIGLQKPSMAAATMTAKGPMLPKSSVKLQKRCPLLYAIPPEIRCMIYSHLLVSADPINSEQANKLIGDKRSVLLSDHNPISGISATLLRTCRKVYNEALPILYGRNVFIFSRPKAIDNFRDSGIDGFTRGRHIFVNHNLSAMSSPLLLLLFWGFKYRLTSGKACDFRKREPQGRLTLLCCVVLKFLPEKTSGGGLWDIPPDPKEPWKIWTRDFLNSRLYDLRFPALRELTLDFLELKLDENIGFRVSTQSTPYSMIVLTRSG